jgi:aromatic-L-amino-acid/L-tryptophan decarboxylase
VQHETGRAWHSAPTMKSDEFRRLGHQLVDWVADYRESLEDRAVMSPVRPGEIRARFDQQPPAQGGRLAEGIAALASHVMPGITHWNHPSFFAYFPSNSSYASVLADLVISGLGVQGMSWQTSPAATEVEEVMMDWLRQMVGLSPAWTGVIHDTASTATLCALLCAREQASGFSQNGPGLQSGGAPLTVYASAEGHSSIEKAALLAGFGRDHLRLLPTDADHALLVPELERAIAEDVAAGRRPAAVVACVGTTGTTAVDAVAPIAALARKHGLWLHVDAAMAGTAMVLPECRWMWEGVEGADSVVFNPHKWMGVGFDLSAYYVRDPALLVRVMSTSPSYLKTAQDGEVKNFRDWHIQLGRRFRALKLWFFLLDVGVEGLRARLRRDLENARWLAEQVDATPGWQRTAPVHLQTVCLRHVPERLRSDEAGLAKHNLAVAARVNTSGKAYLTPSLLKGQQILRVSIGAETTERHHVEALWKLLQEAAAAPL